MQGLRTLLLAAISLAIGNLGAAFGWSMLPGHESSGQAVYILLALAFGLWPWIPAVLATGFLAAWSSKRFRSRPLGLTAAVLAACAAAALAMVSFMPSASLGDQAGYIGTWIAGAACAGFSLGYLLPASPTSRPIRPIALAGAHLAFIAAGIAFSFGLSRADQFRALANSTRILFLAQAPRLIPVEAVPGCDCPSPDTAAVAWGSPAPDGAVSAGWFELTNPYRQAVSLRLILSHSFDTISLPLPKAGIWTAVQSDSGARWDWSPAVPEDTGGTLTLWRETSDASDVYRYWVAFPRKGGSGSAINDGGNGGLLRIRNDL